MQPFFWWRPSDLIPWSWLQVHPLYGRFIRASNSCSCSEGGKLSCWVSSIVSTGSILTGGCCTSNTELCLLFIWAVDYLAARSCSLGIFSWLPWFLPRITAFAFLFFSSVFESLELRSRVSEWSCWNDLWWLLFLFWIPFVHITFLVIGSWYEAILVCFEWRYAPCLPGGDLFEVSASAGVSSSYSLIFSINETLWWLFFEGNWCAKHDRFILFLFCCPPLIKMSFILLFTFSCLSSSLDIAESPPSSLSEYLIFSLSRPCIFLKLKCFGSFDFDFAPEFKPLAEFGIWKWYGPGPIWFDFIPWLTCFIVWICWMPEPTLLFLWVLLCDPEGEMVTIIFAWSPVAPLLWFAFVVRGCWMYWTPEFSWFVMILYLFYLLILEVAMTDGRAWFGRTYICYGLWNLGE